MTNIRCQPRQAIKVERLRVLEKIVLPTFVRDILFTPHFMNYLPGLHNQLSAEGHGVHPCAGQKVPQHARALVQFAVISGNMVLF